MRPFAVALTSLLLLAAGAAQASETGRLFPKTGGSAEIVATKTPKDIKEIEERFGTALAKDPDWLVKHMEKIDPQTGLMPYDKRMGVSEEEYKRYMNAMLHPNYQAIGDVQLDVGHSGSAVSLKCSAPMCGPGLAEGFTFDLTKGTVKGGGMRTAGKLQPLVRGEKGATWSFAPGQQIIIREMGAGKCMFFYALPSGGGSVRYKCG